MKKLWLDDVRPAPEGWEWARTVTEAQRILTDHDVSECSLDHDLGLNYAVEAGVDINDFDALIDYAESLPDIREETGLDLVNWMIEHEKVPDTITIHSWNPVGAGAMAMRFQAHGYCCVVSAYKPH